MSTPQSAILPEDREHGLFLVLHLKPNTDKTVIAAAAASLPIILDDMDEVDSSAGMVGSVGFSSELWKQFSDKRPRHLAPFVALGSGDLTAPATGGDVMLHLNSGRRDLNYLAAKHFIAPLKPYIVRAEETHGFRYLDNRDLSGFIDGTENPEGEDERAETALIGDEDPDFVGGSYALVQRFIHRLDAWEQLADNEQEGIIGRSKPDSVEMEDDVKPETAHISRVVIEEDGEELEIVRHSMPYGEASGESGLMFMAYSKDQTICDKMLARMYGTSDDALSDRLMHFTQPVSGAYFFVPSKEMLLGLV